MRVTAGHIPPNVLPTIIVVETTGLSTGRDHMYQAPGLAICPTVARSLDACEVNMLKDIILDLLDPMVRGW